MRFRRRLGPVGGGPLLGRRGLRLGRRRGGLLALIGFVAVLLLLLKARH